MNVWGMLLKSTSLSQQNFRGKEKPNSKKHAINKFISKVHSYAMLQLIAMFALFIHKVNSRHQYLYLALYKQLLWAEGCIWC